MPGSDLISGTHQEQLTLLQQLRSREPQLELPTLVGVVGPPFRLLTRCESIHRAFRVVDVFTEQLRPQALTLAANTYYFSSQDQEAVLEVQSGELRRRFHDGDPTVLECIQCFTAMVGGMTYTDSIPYDTRSGETVWYEPIRSEGIRIGGAVADRLRMALLEAGKPIENQDPVNWLAAAQALERDGYVASASVQTRGDP